MVSPYIWSQVEPTTALICACMITYRPLFANLNLPRVNPFISRFWIKLRSKSHAPVKSDSQVRLDGANAESPVSDADNRWSGSTRLENRVDVVDLECQVGGGKNEEPSGGGVCAVHVDEEALHAHLSVAEDSPDQKEISFAEMLKGA